MKRRYFFHVADFSFNVIIHDLQHINICLHIHIMNFSLRLFYTAVRRFSPLYSSSYGLVLLVSNRATPSYQRVSDLPISFFLSISYYSNIRCPFYRLWAGSVLFWFGHLFYHISESGFSLVSTYFLFGQIDLYLVLVFVVPFVTFFFFFFLRTVCKNRQYTLII